MTVMDGDPAAVDAGVTRTALSVTMARARETMSRLPLFTDPYAQLLLDAVGTAESPASTQGHSYAAARTKWFDEFFLAASSAGVSQVVILAPGLDTRAWRLPWLNDTVIYEVDEPQVLEFKERVLAASGATPSARRVAVPFESREHWPKSLTSLGFDYTEPTAWAGEGLPAGIAAETLTRILEKVELYSARGSRIAVEVGSEMPIDVSCWLCERHWEVNTTPADELMNRYHRTPAADDGLFIDGRKL
ncbi:SAM-dependent methyltransferase [Mycolicibacterium iranicum]|uniref:S-adenosyl-L-methionine-dependent methyltransferase n=1 Tax=Mycolicibacterium iranicum TaxID=912594 RepID=A0A178LN99_MYCIR|nr:SAM-dependent methyltransferase [Mycolicibacterium iranicum]OAN32649.1 SAM-dependent methyltransferase [Mycolicibacterium iranicum]